MHTNKMEHKTFEYLLYFLGLIFTIIGLMILLYLAYKIYKAKEPIKFK